MNEKWQERTRLLAGEKTLERYANAHVLVVGLGGVGAYAAVSPATTRRLFSPSFKSISIPSVQAVAKVRDKMPTMSMLRFIFFGELVNW